MIPTGLMDTVPSVVGILATLQQQEHLIVIQMVLQRIEKRSQEVTLKEKLVEDNKLSRILSSVLGLYLLHAAFKFASTFP